VRLLTLAFLVAVPAFFAQGLFAQRGGGGRSVGGFRGPVRGTAPGPVARPGGVGPVVAAPYPVYFAGYYPNPFYGGYATTPAPLDYGYDPSQGYGQGYAAQGYPSQGYPAQAPGYAGQGYPPVIVNPNYAPDTPNPGLREYTYAPQPDAAPQPDDQTGAAPSVIFLIAMKDHTIYPAIAYWVEDDTLNYITQQGVRNRVSLDLVDRAFSTELNKERNIDFALPPAK
jgi:hypothetical protein